DAPDDAVQSVVALGIPLGEEPREGEVDGVPGDYEEELGEGDVEDAAARGAREVLPASGREVGRGAHRRKASTRDPGGPKNAGLSAAEQAAVLGHHAAVLDDLDAGPGQRLRGGVVADAELEPDGARLPGERQDLLGVLHEEA